MDAPLLTLHVHNIGLITGIELVWIISEYTGPGYGLSLTINIEQYDYTKNPETGVGIKVRLYRRLLQHVHVYVCIAH